MRRASRLMKPWYEVSEADQDAIMKATRPGITPTLVISAAADIPPAS